MNINDVNQQKKLNRSLALSGKAAMIVARTNAASADTFNKKFLNGDTDSPNNLGVNDIFWYYYKEKAFEYGIYYNKPSLTYAPGDSLITWRSRWDDVINNAILPTGDGTTGFFPPDENGVASSTMNFVTDYLNSNAEQSSTGGLIGNLTALALAAGDTATNLTIFNSPYTYGDSMIARRRGDSWLYGDTYTPGFPAVYKYDRLGKGVLGRRTRGIVRTVQLSGSWRFTIGTGSIDVNGVRFYSDNADTRIPPSGFDGGEKTTLLNAFSTFLLNGDSDSYYQKHIRNLRDQVGRIYGGNGDTNILWSPPIGPTMRNDLYSSGDSYIRIQTYLNTITPYIGNKGDTWGYTTGDTTIWGFYNYFKMVGGGDSKMNNALRKVKSMINSFDGINGLKPKILSRYNGIDDYTNSTILGQTYSTTFGKLRNWRFFWIDERIGKPIASYSSYSGLSSAVVNATTQVTNAENTLIALLGNTTSAHQQYIPTPKALVCFLNPVINRQTGTILQYRTGFAFDGQQHATHYRIYRRAITPIGVHIGDSIWAEGSLYYIDKNVNPNTGFVENIYTDSDPNFISGQKWVYRVRAGDSTNKVSGDSTYSLQSDIFDSTLGTNFTISGDSRIYFGTTHSFRKGQYVVINSIGDTKSGYYYLKDIGDTNLVVTPVIGSTSGTVYLCNCVIFL